MTTRKTRNEHLYDRLADVVSLDLRNASTSVCLASAAKDEPVPTFRRLQTDRALTAEFQGLADGYRRDIESRLRSNDLVVHHYDAGSKPDSHELEYLDLSATSEIIDQIRPLHSLAGMSTFHPDEPFLFGLRFYAIVIQSANEPLVFLRHYSPKKELGRSPWFGALFERGQFNRIKKPLLLFDHHIDCLTIGTEMFISSRSGFQQAFRYYEMVAKVARQSLQKIRDLVPIANFEEFAASCENHLQKLAKLKNIAAKDYLSRVTMEQLRIVIEKNRLPIEIVKKNGKEMLVFNPSDRWAILRLLDDDYLESMMTGHNYEVTGKRVIR